MKKLHEKTVKEISETCCGAGEYCIYEKVLESGRYNLDNCPSVHVIDLKKWAEAIIKENEKEINTMAKDKFANKRLVAYGFPIHKREIGEELVYYVRCGFNKNAEEFL